MMERMQKSYIRDIVDLCYMISGYLDHSDGLIESLKNYIAAGYPDTADSGLEQKYLYTQQVIDYIGQSFKDVYSVQLSTTQQEQEQIRSSNRRLLAIQAGILVVAIGVCYGFYHKVVWGITLSVKKLTNFAFGVTQDPAKQEHIEIATGDELSVFAGAFNEMLDTIHAQMNQIQTDSRMREQLQQVEMENLRISAALQSSQLRLLQSRINPHFLFNTLNMITQTAHMEDAEETAQLMEATAEFLRYNLGKVTKSVTLADEIENTRNYVYIQKCRFGERIRFDFEIDDSCADLEIPCMILQPLVENSISHGVGAMIEGGRVIVRLARKEQTVWLTVEDNGVGIEPERLAELRRSFAQENDDGHIGLKNVYLRLKLFFADQLQFEIESEPHRGTVIRIGLFRPQIPKQAGEAGE
ncbi:MAG TPA: sensor histidine kinase, partial [Candidatus Pygmaiobacter gallistercoris]|nr:sensor histidine kinase [Candidatus Pygmaiobacter gallistercoris]